MDMFGVERADGLIEIGELDEVEMLDVGARGTT